MSHRQGLHSDDKPYAGEELCYCDEPTQPTNSVDNTLKKSENLNVSEEHINSIDSELEDIANELFMAGLGSAGMDDIDVDEQDKAILNMQKHYTNKALQAIKAITKEESDRRVLEQFNKSVELMKEILMENFHYRVMCGDIKDPTGKIDVNKALVEYQELEPERRKFADYIESLRELLNGDTDG